jgi:hypothetical protein
MRHSVILVKIQRATEIHSTKALVLGDGLHTVGARALRLGHLAHGVIYCGSDISPRETAPRQSE